MKKIDERGWLAFHMTGLTGFVIWAAVEVVALLVKRRNKS